MESAKIRLEALTPVRIGSQVGEISPYDYVLFGGKCFVISEEKLSNFLGDRNLIDDFSHSIASKGKSFAIGHYLSEHGVKGESGLSELSSYVVQVNENARPMRLLPIIRDVEQKPYIPGSSIKGAMRTAVIYYMLKRMKETDQDGFDRVFLRYLHEHLKPTDNKKRFSSELEKKLTNSFDLDEFVTDKGFIHDSHTDIFRCLKVSDALPVKPRYRVYDFRVLDKQSNGNLVFESPIFAEALSPGAIFEFQASWDTWLADKFREKNDVPIDGLNDVLNACRTFASDQLASEKSFFEGCNTGGEDPGKILSSLASMEADFRLGWGSGLTGASLSILLPLELRLKLRDLFYRRYARGVREFPKSRRVLVEKGAPVTLVGFCRLEVEE